MKPERHARSLTARFSAAAASYDQYSGMQRAAAARLLGMIGGEAEPGRILEAGCGTGHMTRELRRRWPRALVWAVDIAPGMVDAASIRMAGDEGVRFITGDVRDLGDVPAFPLVAGNCSLHWLHPFAEAMEPVLSLVEPAGLFAASIMLRGTLGELHAARLATAPAKPPLGGMPDDDEVRDVLARHGFSLPGHALEIVQASSPSPEVLMRMLHAQGLTGGALARAHAPLTRGELARLAEYYRQQFGGAGGSVRVTYRIGYYLARRAA
jgi:malonyl-CoA O-methyltransferase